MSCNQLFSPSQKFRRQAQQWLIGRERFEEWSYVWRRLVNSTTEKLDREDLRTLGHRWLSKHADCPEWSHIWRELLNVTADERERRELFEQGYQWLSMHEREAGWPHVWRKVFDSVSNGNRRNTLRSQGHEWLLGHEDCGEWPHVWRKMLESGANDQECETLRYLGRQWLSGRESRDEWTYVWQVLLQFAELSQAGTEISQLLTIGWSWLAISLERDRADWSFVWQRIVREDFAPTNEVSPEALCWMWLQRRTNSGAGEWQFLYEMCLDRRFSDPAFIEAGCTWVESHTHVAGAIGVAAKIWKILKFRRDILPPTGFRLATKRWLNEPCSQKSWIFLWEPFWRFEQTEEAARLLLHWFHCPTTTPGLVERALSTMWRSKCPELHRIVTDWAAANPRHPCSDLVRKRIG